MIILQIIVPQYQTNINIIYMSGNKKTASQVPEARGRSYVLGLRRSIYNLYYGHTKLKFHYIIIFFILCSNS